MTKYYGKRPDKYYSYASRIPTRYKVFAGVVGVVGAVAAALVVAGAFAAVERHQNYKNRYYGFTHAARETMGSTAPAVIGLFNSPTNTPVYVTLPKKSPTKAKPQGAVVNLVA